jgi:hypothetical protein
MIGRPWAIFLTLYPDGSSFLPYYNLLYLFPNIFRGARHQDIGNNKLHVVISCIGSFVILLSLMWGQLDSEVTPELNLFNRLSR